jgi:2-C-methyl-D-erythritol 4-phosphate cytidylyltransferase
MASSGQQSGSVAGLIPAAGAGSRFRGTDGTPKQFLDLEGEPVFVRSIRALLACPTVEAVVCAVASEWHERGAMAIKTAGLSNRVCLIEGGATRQESVRRLLDSASADGPPELVVIHDAARPLVPADVASSAIEAARETGAAVVAAPCTDTIAVQQGGFLDRILDRTELVNIQTPQVFRFDLISEAHARAAKDRVVDATDDSALVLRLGHRVALVPGSPANLKITTAPDLELARVLLRESRHRKHPTP